MTQRLSECSLASVVSLHAAGNAFAKAFAPEFTLVAGYGALGDRHAGCDPNRALLVTSALSYQFLASKDIHLPYGSLGENLILEGLWTDSVPEGTFLTVGDAVLRLTAPCTVCATLGTLDSRLPRLLFGKRGMYAAVMTGGQVKVGNVVSCTSPMFSSGL